MCCFAMEGSDRNAASTETLTQEDNLKGLALMNPQWVELHTPHRRVILDMDSSESPGMVAGRSRLQTGTSSVSAIIPRLFNQFGDTRRSRYDPETA